MTDGAMQRYTLTLNKFLDHAAKWHPHAGVSGALDDGGVEQTGYLVLRRRARRISALLAGLGIGVGDRVATLAWNSRAHLEAWYGIMGMGAVCHTLNPRLTDSQSAAMARQSGARVLIVSADLAPLGQRIAALAPALTELFVIDGDGEPPALESALEDLDDTAVSWGDFDEHSASGLCFTSGTTGDPKGVLYDHRSIYLQTLRLLQADVLGLGFGDRVLAAVPMFHANAWGLPFAAPAAGADLVFPGRHLDGASLARLIATENVTLAAGVPTVWLGLLEHLEAQGGELPSLKRILVGGAPMSATLMARLEQRLGVSVQTSWGMTELSPLGTITPAAEPRRDAASAGRVAVGMDLLLTDEQGTPLPEQRNVEGHLRVRGAAVVERYLGQRHGALDERGWFATGDLARIDEQGRLTITGRAKDLIKSGGEWINPAELEAIAGALPAVAQAAVIGRRDGRWGERPVLVIETKPAQTIEDREILDAMRDRVASWWLPDAVVRVDRMPLAGTGKIDKKRLRAEFGQA
ncbi:AMP-binding protein [Alloalcanivorax sp. C16-2]|uniref:AMP-binding protein n=1 Tax=Alloalcanivorax TaxID=3020832 RepID=UPI00193290BC|nr:AMP-binding protein [Alloalcanivorax marinus]MBL7249309.1 AMP-binding protein [Alloalcanivorax marinus]